MAKLEKMINSSAMLRLLSMLVSKTNWGETSNELHHSQAFCSTSSCEFVRGGAAAHSPLLVRAQPPLSECWVATNSRLCCQSHWIVAIFSHMLHFSVFCAVVNHAISLRPPRAPVFYARSLHPKSHSTAHHLQHQPEHQPERKNQHKYKHKCKQKFRTVHSASVSADVDQMLPAHWLDNSSAPYRLRFELAVLVRFMLTFLVNSTKSICWSCFVFVGCLFVFLLLFLCVWLLVCYFVGCEGLCSYSSSFLLLCSFFFLSQSIDFVVVYLSLCFVFCFALSQKNWSLACAPAGTHTYSVWPAL